MNREKKKKKRQFAQGTIFSKMKEKKNHLGFHTDNLEEIEVEDKNTKQTKGKRKKQNVAQGQRDKSHEAAQGTILQKQKQKKKIERDKRPKKKQERCIGTRVVFSFKHCFKIMFIFYVQF